jgi:hypothetical protein
MLSLYEMIDKGGMGELNDPNDWFRRVRTTSVVEELTDCLLEFQVRF